MTEPLLLRSPGQLGADLARRKTELTTSAQLLVFEPGLYSIDFRAVQSGSTDIGLRLPAARLEPVPPAPNGGRAFVSISSEGGWLVSNTEAAFVLVTGGRASAVLTIYRASDGMPAPEIRVRPVLQGGDLRAAAAATPALPPARVAAARPPAPAEVPQAHTPGALPVNLLVHVTGVGDIPGKGGVWAGNPASTAPIEGFAVTGVPGVDLKEIECQGVLGQDWATPWHPGGEFCGSRGLALSLLGFRIRLTGAAARGFECQYWGSFAGHGIVGPVTAGAACESSGAPLTSLRVEIVPRGQAEVAPAAAAAGAAVIEAPKAAVKALGRGKAVVAADAKTEPKSFPKRSK